VTRYVDKSESDLQAEMEGHDRLDDIRVRDGTRDMFVELLCLLQSALVVTSNGDTSRKDLSLLTEKFECYQEGMNTL